MNPISMIFNDIKKNATLKSTTVVLSTMAVLFISAGSSQAEEISLPKPTAEHQWLQQFAGNWEADVMMAEPGKAAVQSKGTESARSLGGFWIVSEGKGSMGNNAYENLMNLGYDNDKKKYVSTWIDSMTGHMWTSEGELDAAKKTLTLNSEGPCPMMGGKNIKMKDVIEFQDKDTKTMTSSMLGDDGKWVTVVSAKSHRVK